MIFYDFEVFKEDWLVVLVDSDNQEETVVVNSRDELEEFHTQHIDDIWVGYNSANYDRYILKGILCGFDPKEVNDFIIVENCKGWEFSSLFNKIKLLNYDVMTDRNKSLKQLEGFMGHDIRETTVDFKIDRKLTESEIDEVIFYCRHDVFETIEVFMRQIDEFNSHISLISEFNLPIRNVSKTKPQLSATILKAQRIERDDEMNITIVDTIRLNKYKYIQQWYEQGHTYGNELKTNVLGVEHVFAWGGLHGAIPHYHDKGFYIMLDVASMYPAIMIEYDFLSRNVQNKSDYKVIRDDRLRLKANKDPKQAPRKIVLNSTYGASKDKYNALFDPLQANNVCVNGQLLLLDLVEKLEGYCQLIQSNTDGILIKCEREDFDLIDDIVYEWEERTRLQLEFDFYKEVHQKDVNNYILIPFGKLRDEGGKPRWKSKGAFVKKLNPLDYDLAIVNEAITQLYINKIPVETTINKCDELIKFQKIIKISSKFEGAVFGNERRHERVFRVFAAKTGKQLMKLKNGKAHKIGNVPVVGRIVNTNIEGERVPDWLDKQWYIDLANERVKQFGGGYDL